MDRNFALALGLSFAVLALWSIYTGDAKQEPGETATEADAPEAAAGPAAGREDEPFATAGGALARAEAPERQARAAEERFWIQTSLYDAEFSTRGGALLHWKLREYRDRFQPGHPEFEITTLDEDREVALATPLEELGFGDLSEAPYSVERRAGSLVFEREQAGIRVRKTYLLEEGSYAFRLRIELENGSDRELHAKFRTLWPARHVEAVDYAEHSVVAHVDGDLEQTPLVGGGSLFGSGGGFEEPVQYTGELDWAGAQTRYFVAALLPDAPREAAARFSALGPKGALVEVAFQPVSVPAGQRAARELRVYLGPKEPEQLDAVGAGLDEAILKGWFPALTDFFVWVLAAANRLIGNFGLAIIVITVIVRLLLAPIMMRQVKSMRRMGEMQPQMKAIQEKYADDRQKQSEEMMKLWKESGFNPMAGCLPIFLQLPVFLGLYYALQGSIELRQAPFFGWITDLSAPETLFTIPGLEIPVRLLPLLMGGSMLVQQRLTPTTMDPAQARMMNTVMPVMFTFLFYQFASGLVLYWFVSNVLGIAQQVWGKGGGRKQESVGLAAGKPAEKSGGKERPAGTGPA